MGLFSRRTHRDRLEGFREKRATDEYSEAEARLHAFQEQLKENDIPEEEAQMIVLGDSCRRFCEGLATADERLRVGRYLTDEATTYIQRTFPEIAVTKGLEAEETKRAYMIAVGLAQAIGWLNSAIEKGDEVARQWEADDGK